MTIATYTKFEHNQLQQQKNHSKITPFVEVTHNGKTCFIRKTTAVWLFQECERVSTDRLFRVRSTQPYSADCVFGTKSTSSQASIFVPQLQTTLVPQVNTSSSPILSTQVKTSSLVPQVKTSSSPTLVSQVKTSSSMAGQGESRNPNVKQIISGLTDSLTRQYICIGHLCVFKAQHKWRIGKVLQFYYQDGKTQKACQCNQTSLNITAINKRIAVVCSWFSWYPQLSVNTFSIYCASLNYPNYCSVNDCFNTVT